ncbi:MAG: alpha/beta fold hydrolase [Acetobacter orientalis]
MSKSLFSSVRCASWSASFLLLSACAAPVAVRQLSLPQAYQQQSQSALNSKTPSATTLSILRRLNLLDTWRKNPTNALAQLRTMTQQHFYAQGLADQLFALSELSYLHARKTSNRAYFMAAALYAYAYLNPTATEAEKPSAFDPHFRQACDLYMFGMTEAFGSPILQTTQQWALPFGTLSVNGTPQDFKWHDHPLTDLRPLASLSVSGFENVYSHMGLGEPVGGLPRLSQQERDSFQISDKLRVPLNLQLQFTMPRQQVLSPHVQATLTLTAMDTATHTVEGGPTPIPLQYNQTAARAVSLNETMDWSTEYKGFLDGRLFDQTQAPQLLTIDPHQYGHRPVVLVHGTASSAARWANMVNDLMEDPTIRQNYEFWFFSYATGNPIPYSALQLRRALQQAVKQLGGTQSDPALNQMTLIGHSQGGLLIKLLTINAGDTLWNGMVPRPLDSLKISQKYKDFLHEVLFPTPLPEVKSVVFISTPQHGSYLAGFSIAHMIGRMVTFPLTVTEATKAVLSSDPALRRLNMAPWRVGSVYGMSPRSAFMRTLATIPVTSDVTAHSIIPVLGSGALENADDGVVAYKSAHIPEARSELVVRHSGHSTQSNPITIAEVRRILLEQLQTQTPDEHITRQDITSMGGHYEPTQPAPFKATPPTPQAQAQGL